MSGSRDKTVGVWRVSNGKRIKTIIGHSRSVKSVEVSPDGEYLATGSDDRTIALFLTANI